MSVHLLPHNQTPAISHLSIPRTRNSQCVFNGYSIDTAYFIHLIFRKAFDKLFKLLQLLISMERLLSQNLSTLALGQFCIPFRNDFLVRAVRPLNTSSQKIFCVQCVLASRLMIADVDHPHRNLKLCGRPPHRHMQSIPMPIFSRLTVPLLIMVSRMGLLRPLIAKRSMLYPWVPPCPSKPFSVMHLTALAWSLNLIPTDTG
jgi:hypothetical protein